MAMKNSRVFCFHFFVVVVGGLLIYLFFIIIIYLYLLAVAPFPVSCIFTSFDSIQQSNRRILLGTALAGDLN